MKVVTLDLGGGKLGGSSEDIQIIVKNGSEFTAPASGGFDPPRWKYRQLLYVAWKQQEALRPGESVPEVVTTLTAQWMIRVPRYL